MADSSGSSRRSGGSRSHRRQASVDSGDLEEEDVLSATPRMIPRANPVANDARTPHRSSAPVNIPNWSKIYGKTSRKVEGSSFGSRSSPWADYQQDDENRARDEEEEEEEEDEDEDGIIPPHEWIARKLARSHISNSSMCEGKGRTLKGRDLSKVRNAVLTKTGFLE